MSTGSRPSLDADQTVNKANAELGDIRASLMYLEDSPGTEEAGLGPPAKDLSDKRLVKPLF